MNRLPAPLEYEDVVVARRVRFADSKLALVVTGALVGLGSVIAATFLGLFR